MATAMGRARSARAALISILALTAMALSAGGVSAAPPSPITVDQTSLSFGSVFIGDTSTTQTVQVATGRKAVVLEVWTDDGQFAIGSTSTCLATWAYQLPPDTTCTIDLTFAPITAHTFGATLFLDACMKSDSDPLSGLPMCTRVRDEVTVSLAGTGENLP